MDCTLSVPQKQRGQELGDIRGHGLLRACPREPVGSSRVASHLLTCPCRFPTRPPHSAWCGPLRASLTQRNHELCGQMCWPPESSYRSSTWRPPGAVRRFSPFSHWKTPHTPAPGATPLHSPHASCESWGLRGRPRGQHRALLSRSLQSHLTTRKEPGLRGQERQWLHVLLAP